MSNQAICIEPQGKTPNVPPRYTPPGPVPGAPAPPPPRSGCSWSGIERMPYAIQNSEFGILKSDFGNRPNRRPAPLDFRKQAIQPLSAPHPLSPYSPTIKRAPRPLPAPAIHIHTQSAGFPFHVVEWRWLKTSIGGGYPSGEANERFRNRECFDLWLPPDRFQAILGGAATPLLRGDSGGRLGGRVYRKRGAA